MMAEPAAGLLSNDDCMAFSTEYVRRIVESVQDEGFMVVLHNCGNTGHCTRAMVATGAAAYHFGNKCRMEEVAREVPPTALVMGNVDPVGVMKEGMPFQVRQAVGRLMESMRGHDNFVVSTGCDIAPHTPTANIEAFFETVGSYGQ
jgi:uroporphyrinogen decarboxylase